MSHTGLVLTTAIPPTEFPIPSITAIRVVDGVIQVEWTVSNPLTDPGGYLISFCEGDTVKKNVVSDKQSSQFLPPDNLSPQSIYTIKVACGSGSEIGSYSLPVPVLLLAPNVTSAIANGVTADIAWNVPSPYDAYKGYAAFVYEGNDTEIGSQQGEGTTSEISIPGPLQLGQNYFVRVQLTSGVSSGPLSNSFSLKVLKSPEITRLAYSDSTSPPTLSLNWQLTDPSVGNDYLVSVFQGETVVENKTGTGSSLQFQPSISLDPQKLYTVKVASTSGKTIGPYSEAVAIYTAKPEVQSLVYNGTNIVAKLNYQTGTVYGNGFLLSLLKDGTVIQNVVGEGTTAELTPTAAFDTNSNYTIQVATAEGVSIGSYSAPSQLLLDAPSISSAHYDGDTISASFHFPNVSRTGLNFVFALFADGVKIQEQSGTGTSASMTPASPLQTSSKYSLQVASTKDIARGPYSKPVTVLSDVLQIVSGSWNGTSISTNWLFPSSNVTNRGTLITFYKDGKVIQNSSISSGSSGSLTPSTPFPESGSVYTIEVALANEVFVGPYSQPLTVITDTPTITSVTFTGQEIHAGMTYPGTPTRSFILSLFQDDKLIQSSAGTGQTATLVPITPPVSSSKYATRAAFAENNFIGNYSNPINIIVSNPEITALNYDGDAIGVVVQFPDPSAGMQYEIALLTNGILQKTSHATGSNGILNPDNRLSAGIEYTVQVASVQGNVKGPFSAPQSLAIVVSPEITSVVYDGSNLEVHWALANPSIGEGYLLSIFSGTKVVRNAPPGTGTSTTVDNVSGLFEKDSGYTVRVASTKNDQIGPYSVGVEIIIAKPSAVSAGYNGSKISLNWLLPNMQLTGICYKVSLFHNGSFLQASSGFGVSTSFTPSEQPVAGESYTATVSSVQGISTGQPSDPINIAIIAAPTLTALGYNGNQISANWLYPDTSDGYLLSVFNGDTVYFNETSNVPTKTFAPPQGRPLDPNVQYTLKIAISLSGSIGPYSIPLPIIQQAPSISNVSFNGSELSLNWTIPDNSVGDGFLVSIFKGSSVYQNWSGTGSSTSFTVKPFPDAGPYTIAIASASNASIGPYSNPSIAIVTSSPNNAKLNYNGEKLEASWSYTVATGTTFEACLYKDGTLVETVPTNSLTTSFATDFLPGFLYTANVRAKTGNSSGPPSEMATGPFSAVRQLTFDPLDRIQSINSENYNSITWDIDNAGNIETQTYNTTNNSSTNPSSPQRNNR
ncbi:MAG: hypothetical protein AAF518_06115 [Spirochaetota bacterium]